MFWSWLKRKRVLDAGERARQQHSAWLTQAVRRSQAETRAEPHAQPGYPQIPRRTVRDGGFDGLRSRPHGPERSARWWSIALDRVETEPPRDDTSPGTR